MFIQTEFGRISLCTHEMFRPFCAECCRSALWKHNILGQPCGDSYKFCQVPRAWCGSSLASSWAAWCGRFLAHAALRLPALRVFQSAVVSCKYFVLFCCSNLLDSGLAFIYVHFMLQAWLQLVGMVAMEWSRYRELQMVNSSKGLDTTDLSQELTAMKV